MPRKVIPVITGEKYHVFNRGVDKREIFLEKHDYLRYYQSLAFFNTVEPTINYRLAKATYSKDIAKLVAIEAYSLLSNHFHFIIEQKIDGGLSEFMKRVTGGYTSYFNEKYERTGALLQGTYKKVHIDSDEQYNYLFAYVNENHFVHGYTTEREMYHSSSLHYQDLGISKLIEVHTPYSFKDSKALAQLIYTKRKEMKALLEV